MDCKRLWPVAGMVKPTLLVRTGRRSGLCYQFTRIILHYYILCFVRFQFEENVSTFAAGLYSLSPGMTTPALVYVTFNNKIQVSSCEYCHYQYNCKIVLSCIITLVSSEASLCPAWSTGQVWWRRPRRCWTYLGWTLQI